MATKAPVFDFTGDSTSDLLVIKGYNALSVWAGHASSFTEDAVVDSGVPTSYNLRAIGDFDGDGKTDLLWNHYEPGTFNDYSIWSSTGSSFTHDTSLIHVNDGWSLAATGDFDGDGKTDLLWRNTDGLLSEWHANGTPSFELNASFEPNVFVEGVETRWSIQKTGDFNGDGRDDVLWGATDGTVTVWTSTGSGFAENTFVDHVQRDWHADAVGDFNGDGQADLLWRNSDGTAAFWQADNGSFIQNTHVERVDTDWVVNNSADYNGDGLADLLWSSVRSGVFTEWESTGTGFHENVYAHAGLPPAEFVI